MQNEQCAHRGAFNDSVLEKSIGASYGSNEYGSNISRNLGLGIRRPGGRVTESGHDKSWYSKSGVVAGTMSGQGNGLGLKYSFLNTEAPKSMILDVHHQPTQNISSTRTSVISVLWILNFKWISVSPNLSLFILGLSSHPSDYQIL